MELVARAYGATDPGHVAQCLDPASPDILAALSALRQQHPEWFVPATMAPGVAGNASLPC